MAGKYRLSNLDLNEVSLVGSGDDPTAKVLIFKSDGSSVDVVEHDEDELVEKGCKMHKDTKRGERCPGCGYIRKGMPEGQDLYVKGEMDAGFKHKDKMKRKKRKKMYPDLAMPIDAGVDNMARGMSKERDGDGDGMIYDGTPRQRPANPMAGLSRRRPAGLTQATARARRSRNRRQGKPESPISQDRTRTQRAMDDAKDNMSESDYAELLRRAAEG